MSTPGGAVAPYTQGSATPPAPVVYDGPPPVVEPSAMSSAKSSAVFRLGQVLKTVIHNSRSFLSENDVDAAISVVDSFVGAFIPGGELAALVTGVERAAKEDVSQRVAPGMTQQVMGGPVLDYQKLAQAILAEQKRLQLGDGS
jgi:hypothetical protein